MEGERKARSGGIGREHNAAFNYKRTHIIVSTLADNVSSTTLLSDSVSRKTLRLRAADDMIASRYNYRCFHVY